jgi:hypothetical protein
VRRGQSPIEERAPVIPSDEQLGGFALDEPVVSNSAGASQSRLATGEAGRSQRVDIPAGRTNNSIADSAATTARDLARAIELAREGRDAARQLRDYTAVFTKKEQIGRSPRLLQQSMDLKFRAEPFSVYMSFHGSEAGREILYVHGRNKNQLLVQETGILGMVGTVPLSPKDSRVTAENRYPVTRLGVLNLADTIIAQWEKAEQSGGVDKVQYYPNAKLGEVHCRVLETTHNTPREGIPFHVTRLYLQADNQVPIRVEQLGFPRSAGQKLPIIEEYTYSNLRGNVGLTDRDFDQRNPEYGFR